MKCNREILLPILEQIRSGSRKVEVAELWGGAQAMFLVGIVHETGRSLIVVTSDAAKADSLAGDLRFFVEQTSEKSRPEILLFPALGVLPFEADSPDTSTVGERMRVLYRLMTAGPSIVVVPIAALMQKLPPWQLFADAVPTVSVKQQESPDRLADVLAALGYEHATLVTRVGEFSRRGGIIDFFSPALSDPVRAEFFGDTIESLRVFDPETQRSAGELSKAAVLPVRELIITPEGLNRFRKQAQEQGIHDIEFLDQFGERSIPPGGEFFAPFFYTMEPLFRYVPEDSIAAFVEPGDCASAVAERMQKILDGRHEEIAEGRILPEASSLYMSNDEISAAAERFPIISLSLVSTTTKTVRMDTKSSLALGVRLGKTAVHTRTQEPVPNSMADFVSKLKIWREKNRVAIVCGTDEAAARLSGLLSEHGLFAARGSRLSSENDALTPVTILEGRLSAGFAWPALQLIVITDEEIFGERIHRPRSTASRTAPFLSSFKELQPGDLVVHVDYGVGEYLGLTHLTVEGYETDYLTIRYEPDAKLYVPLYSLDKVQKYTGAEGAPPRINRLGAPGWARTKERAKKDILVMARELAAIYAAREAMTRTPLAPPDNLYREFESAFPFEETPDQQKAIEDVLADLQKPQPMDRLVCGDVGFGKTEVALRAAFKVVEDGYQAAIIVPTTLLADQHFRTFSERLAPFSINVDLLSRFRSRAEQKETIRKLRAGSVDIVIGTHRLFQKDVAFKNLGLLVIDEEHRFGVRHKERIKEMRKMVDVLTLTATPIPRTLHLSLAGLRDLSIIQTPPLDRQAIQVVVARFSKRVIREAIEAELDRGGQVFFVQNRVAGIERTAAFLQNLMPKAKIGVAHGQMKEDEVEEVMARFVGGELNILVTTTIIESGIDIPNANTIIINRADRFGLAELYQIKGRVGRSRQKAFAYLLTPEDGVLSDAARTRLRAIQELSELGAGFRIAARDLESRGAGNLLGKQQSGHIAAVGIDLYTQMVEEAMAELRGEEVREEPDTQVNLRASAFLPESYISDVGLRLAAYKEIAGALTEREVDEIAAGLSDRYGALPEPAKNLLEIMKLRIDARAAMISRIDGGEKSVSITFAESARVQPDKIMKLIKQSGGKVKLVPEYTLRITLPEVTLKAAIEAVKKCLQELGLL